MKLARHIGAKLGFDDPPGSSLVEPVVRQAILVVHGPDRIFGILIQKEISLTGVLPGVVRNRDRRSGKELKSLLIPLDEVVILTTFAAKGQGIEEPIARLSRGVMLPFQREVSGRARLQRGVNRPTLRDELVELEREDGASPFIRHLAAEP
jgi:hypothetical protein